MYWWGRCGFSHLCSRPYVEPRAAPAAAGTSLGTADIAGGEQEVGQKSRQLSLGLWEASEVMLNDGLRGAEGTRLEWAAPYCHPSWIPCPLQMTLWGWLRFSCSSCVVTHSIGISMDTLTSYLRINCSSGCLRNEVPNQNSASELPFSPACALPQASVMPIPPRSHCTPDSPQVCPQLHCAVPQRATSVNTQLGTKLLL